MMWGTTTRSLWRGALAALAALVVASALPAAATARAPSRPNVVLIVTDDQAAHTVRPDTMPNLLNLIVPRATSFSDAIVTTPLCCPSRASMLTGQYGHNNGVLRNDYRELSKKSNVLPAWLQKAGYRTIHVGKFLNLYRKARGPEAESAPGWDVWQTLQEPNTYYDYKLSINGRKVDFGTDDSDYLTDVLSRKAARLVRRSAPGRRPFFLQLDEWAPHDSPGRGTGVCGGGHDPVPGPADEGLFATEPLPRTPAFNEEDVSDKPAFIQHQQPVNAGAVERNYRCGLASLRAVDRGIARIHRALRRSGELDDTVIIFTSDNGYFYGEHRLRFKQLPYEEALHVPLLITIPPRLLAGGTRPPEVGLPVANIDLAPTILALARAKPCRGEGSCRVMDGRSLVPLLRGEEGKWPQDRALVVEYTGRHHGFSSCSYQGLRVSGETYIEHTLTPNHDTGLCEPVLEIEHYDLGSDPFQLDNLYPATESPAYAERQRELASRLAALRDCAGIAGRDAPKPGRPNCE